MASTPDLSGIVNLIMQNPSLIEQISALANSKTESEAPTEVTNEDVPTVNDTPTEVSASSTSMKSHRHELLNAMKPYLSENRRVAIDSMSSILDVIDLMMKK